MGDRPCPNGCGADAWDIDTVDGRQVIHFVHCKHGWGKPVRGARPWMGAIYGFGRWLRALLTGGEDSR